MLAGAVKSNGLCWRAQFRRKRPRGAGCVWTSPAEHGFMRAMMLDEEDIAGLPGRLFAMAGRRLEAARHAAGSGEARGVTGEERCALAGELHDCAQDISVIADTISALTTEHLPR